MLLCYVRLSDVILIHRGVVGEFSYPPAAAAPHTGLGWETLNKDPIRIFPLTAASTSSIAILYHTLNWSSITHFLPLDFFISELLPFAAELLSLSSD